jgi:hypothetical protein
MLDDGVSQPKEEKFCVVLKFCNEMIDSIEESSFAIPLAALQAESPPAAASLHMHPTGDTAGKSEAGARRQMIRRPQQGIRKEQDSIVEGSVCTVWKRKTRSDQSAGPTYRKFLIPNKNQNKLREMLCMVWNLWMRSNQA